eukprot:PLAT7058.2.p1 GENE.PLAT7058.2~~PLAT7058.2.p1  ORF type:complete len:325 (-),score=73.17 PLAT7058.2:100-1035(-)
MEGSAAAARVSFARASRKLWLLRIPEALMERMRAASAKGETTCSLEIDWTAVRETEARMQAWEEECAAESTVAGGVRRSRKPPPPKDLPNCARLIMDDEEEEKEEKKKAVSDDDGPVALKGRRRGAVSKRKLPKECSLHIVMKPSPSLIFSDTRGKFAMQGRSVLQGALRPARRDAGYRQLLRDRLLKSQVKTAVVKTIDEPDPSAGQTSIKLFTPAPSASSSRGSKRKREDEGRGGREKRQRLPEADLRSRLFALFEDKQYWTFKELNYRLHQPDSYLKDHLRKVAEYHKSGPNRNHYSLRSQYAAHRPE